MMLAMISVTCNMSSICSPLKSLRSFNDDSPDRRGRLGLSRLRTESWASRSSHCSGSSFNNDDFNWAIQPNYLNMMDDNNIMENCAAANHEIESMRTEPSDEQLKNLASNDSPELQSTVDVKQLMQWITYMEKYIATISPDWQQVDLMGEDERTQSYNEQRELREYIESHDRIFKKMVKDGSDSEETRMVQEKFHKLLLNALEKQCLLEGYPKDSQAIKTSDRTNAKLSINEQYSINIQPQPQPNRNKRNLRKSSESYAITSDDGVNFSSNPNTSKTSSFSEEQISPFSSNKDFSDKGNRNGVQSSTDETPKNTDLSFSPITDCTLRLIQDVTIPSAKDFDDSFPSDIKVKDWLTSRPHEAINTKNASVADDENQSISNNFSSSSTSDHESAASIQWDNFQTAYPLTPPVEEEFNKDFLYFGDDYDNALGRPSSSSSRNTAKSNEFTETPPGREKSVKQQTKNSSDSESLCRCRGRRHSARKLNEKTDVFTQRRVLDDQSEMARNILTIVEELRNNYKNLKPEDFDGIIKLCRDNMGCLILVLGSERSSHYCSSESSSSSEKTVYDFHVQQSCRCLIISGFIGQIVNFLYGSSRVVRNSVIYKFLFNILKTFYRMIKFFSQRVIFYRSIYR
ncbi:hypothetical protein Bhyg_11666 [Pseudolycoriella hygida]|uniref:Uncharacterized protein n=1 Tax=Pseudolycoriella hygida TaxID=35572 RepID=A0A9Q0S0J2_9DIPT|nr:hypothetical protein Bhyg_11666 [Pseudolycoriella hygida]